MAALGAGERERWLQAYRSEACHNCVRVRARRQDDGRVRELFIVSRYRRRRPRRWLCSVTISASFGQLVNDKDARFRGRTYAAPGLELIRVLRCAAVILGTPHTYMPVYWAKMAATLTVEQEQVSNFLSNVRQTFERWLVYRDLSRVVFPRLRNSKKRSSDGRREPRSDFRRWSRIPVSREKLISYVYSRQWTVTLADDRRLRSFILQDRGDQSRVYRRLQFFFCTVIGSCSRNSRNRFGAFARKNVNIICPRCYLADVLRERDNDCKHATCKSSLSSVAM